MSGLAALTARARYPLPVVQTYHALGSVKRRYQGDKDTSPAQRIGYERVLGRQVDQVIGQCSDEVNELIALGIPRSAIRLVSSGVDTERFSPGGPQAQAPRPGGRILSVGRLVERKGVSHLVDAVRLLSPGVDVRLMIVGDGPERARIEGRVREQGLDGRVAVRGRVSEAELQAAYAGADAFVLPAVLDRRGDTEGLGVVLLEAMNQRVPVIASAIGGIRDIVEDGVSGLLVPPGDAAALAAALERLARAPDLAARLGEAGCRRLRERFSWDEITGRWEALYAAVAGRRG
jgi:glycosyltransferase involved in cell wall biosynthesis